MPFNATMAGSFGARGKFGKLIALPDALNILGDNSCIALWKLDGNSNETSGNYNGTSSGVTFNTTVKRIGTSSAQFGTSRTISIPAVKNTYPFSVSVWARKSDWQGIPLGNQEEIFNISISGQRVSLGLTKSSTWNSGNTVVTLMYGGVNHTGVDLPDWEDNTWHNIVWVVRGSNDGDIYLDGVKRTLISFGGGHGGTPGWNIGSNSTGGEYWQGYLDNVRFFNKALSDSEVSSLYLLENVSYPSFLYEKVAGGNNFKSESTYFTNSTDQTLTTLATSWSGSNQNTYFGGSQTTSGGGRASWSYTLNNGNPLPAGSYGINIRSYLELNTPSSHDGMFAYIVTPTAKYYLNLSANPPYPTGTEFIRTGLFTLPSETTAKVWITVADGSSAYAMGGRTYDIDVYPNNLLYSPAPNSFTLVEETGHPTTGDGNLGTYSNGSNWPGRYSAVSNNNVIGFRFTSPVPVKYWKVDYSGWNITRLTDLGFQTSTALSRGASSLYWPDITNSITSTTTPGTFYIPAWASDNSMTMWLTSAQTFVSYIDVNLITAYG